MDRTNKYTDPTCFVCGREPHADNFNPATGNGHNYWSTADAFQEAREHDRQTIVRTREAAYVAEYRPY